jgi:hypothetical protein
MRLAEKTTLCMKNALQLEGELWTSHGGASEE